MNGQVNAVAVAERVKSDHKRVEGELSSLNRELSLPFRLEGASWETDPLSHQLSDVGTR